MNIVLEKPKGLSTASPAAVADSSTFHHDNLWRCADCKRIRTCPWDHLTESWLIGFAACSCGDACIPNSEVGPADPFLALTIARHLCP